MRVIFHQGRWHPKYHRGKRIEGKFTSDCGSLKDLSYNVKTVLTDQGNTGAPFINLPVIDLCGNCFRDARKATVKVHASRLSK